MYITRTKKVVGDKEYRSVLLVKSVRIDGKPRHETILNLSRWSDEQVDALAFALKGKKGEAGIGTLDEVSATTDKEIGGVLVVAHLAKKLGITEALGTTKEARLAMALIAGRLLTQGSRLKLCEWQKMNELEACLDVPHFSEDDLYTTLDWLSKNQAKIEARLFRKRYADSDKKPALFLYDITSSYLEGVDNELGKYGYNRDRKKGKQQIVIGLLTDQQGVPVSIEVFEGNRSDNTTVIAQVEKMAKRFGVAELVLVGDKGMIKRTQIQTFTENTHYITSITNAQIKTLIARDVIQLSLFENELVEVEDNGVRYILRKNPVRATEIQTSRQSRIDTVQEEVEKANSYLGAHSRANVTLQKEKLIKKLRRFHLHEFAEIRLEARVLTLEIDTQKQNELAKHDGCYVLKTDTTKESLPKEAVHARYKDLAKVESAFRTIKTGMLEIRPVYVRKESRTRGHVLVTMLAYMIAQSFWEAIKPLQLTAADAWGYVSQLQTIRLSVPKANIPPVKKIQTPTPICASIFSALNLKIQNLSFTPVV
jgi:transposase